MYMYVHVLAPALECTYMYMIVLVHLLNYTAHKHTRTRTRRTNIRTFEVEPATVELDVVQLLHDADAVTSGERQLLVAQTDRLQAALEAAQYVTGRRRHLAAEVHIVVIQIQHTVAVGGAAFGRVRAVDGDLSVATVALDHDAMPQTVVDAHGVRLGHALAAAAVEAILDVAVVELDDAVVEVADGVHETRASLDRLDVERQRHVTLHRHRHAPRDVAGARER